MPINQRQRGRDFNKGSGKVVHPSFSYKALFRYRAPASPTPTDDRIKRTGKKLTHLAQVVVEKKQPVAPKAIQKADQKGSKLTKEQLYEKNLWETPWLSQVRRKLRLKDQEPSVPLPVSKELLKGGEERTAEAQKEMMRSLRTEVKLKKVEKRALFAQFFRTLLHDYDHQEKKCVMILQAKSFAPNCSFQQIRAKFKEDKDTVVVYGVTTVIQRVIQEENAHSPHFAKLLPLLKGRLVFIFTHTRSLLKIQRLCSESQIKRFPEPNEVIQETVYPDITLRIDPSRCATFAIFGLPTKITRGEAHWVDDKWPLYRPGDKVTPLQLQSLRRLGWKMLEVQIFSFVGMLSDTMFFPPSVLHFGIEDLVNVFHRASFTSAALCLGANYPTSLSLPFTLLSGFNLMLSLSLETTHAFALGQAFLHGLRANKAGVIEKKEEEKKSNDKKKKDKKKEGDEKKNLPVTDEKWWLGRELLFVGSGLPGSVKLQLDCRKSLEIFLVRDILNLVYAYLDLTIWNTTKPSPKPVEWSCPACTYLNDAKITKCVMCRGLKPRE